jgi:hypothetical protein
MPAIQTQVIYCGDNLQKLRDLASAPRWAQERRFTSTNHSGIVCAGWPPQPTGHVSWRW